MSWKLVSQNWNLEKPRLQRRWDKLTSADLEIISANRDKLVERLCARYGLKQSEASRHIEEWEDENADRLHADETVERASEDSFPASDPPSLTPPSSVRKDRSDSKDNVTAAPHHKQVRGGWNA